MTLTTEEPTLVIQTPIEYQRSHQLAECPICHESKPFLVIYMPVREFGFFDLCLYNCHAVCDCNFNSDIDPITNKVTIKPHKHKFSAKHEILTDAQHLKIYDRTHFKDIW